MQRVDSDLEIIITGSLAREDLETVEKQLISNDYRHYNILDVPETSSLNKQLLHARRHATGDYLLIACPEIMFHDPRSLQTLCKLANHERVASVGCVLVKDVTYKKTTKVEYYSGGIFVSTSTSGEYIASEPDCYEAFSKCTYPVLANSSRLFMVRTENWDKTGGYSGDDDFSSYADIDYGLRAIQMGYINVCTSIISAGLQEYRTKNNLYKDVILQHHGKFKSVKDLIRLSGSIGVLRP